LSLSTLELAIGPPLRKMNSLRRGAAMQPTKA
jgi:hypothetical protein